MSDVWKLGALCQFACWDEADLYHVSAHFSFLWKGRCAGWQGMELRLHSLPGLDQSGRNAAHSALPPSLQSAMGLNLESLSQE